MTVTIVNAVMEEYEGKHMSERVKPSTEQPCVSVNKMVTLRAGSLDSCMRMTDGVGSTKVVLCRTADLLQSPYKLNLVKAMIP